MVSVRIPVAIVFALTLALAAYLGFASIHFEYDKFLHFSVFFVLAIEFYFIIDTHHKSLKTLRLVTCLWCVGSSVVSEIVQSIVNPSRKFDVYDIMANLGGSFLGLVVAASAHAYTVRRARAGRYRKLARSEVENTGRTDGEEFVNIKMQDLEDGTGPSSVQ
ncbi:hypothetical protein PSN45_002576 [Yamadazyma tenuis]|uniref:VanZ-like domain-containing protein n=1 Tax=Candida tenuis (strain ATCC 10573 / BCRC 21748 / CBS 615 / JCM 9827 / NBRC 10315 / NRRL Y-1498 / VKM Y-70) TaxID=590646 RepID=G3AZZ4_CANTC|nr:uncharacterized protein CANTEDRAFT_113016 [Yamadazyma tenuis ATCC 10573]EGV65487.1 hypothetical protein CANTEDRAFT_113016 [Yamadazyma tenuis ATCC 10573]WEJ95067.1 hypothetical protein PSN45_002576 [Yamadazyma tenuis]